MPQLNQMVFYDVVFISFFFVLGFVFFIKIFLPFIIFFSKKNNYLIFHIFKEMNISSGSILGNMFVTMFFLHLIKFFYVLSSILYNRNVHNYIFCGVYLNDMKQVLLMKDN